MLEISEGFAESDSSGEIILSIVFYFDTIYKIFDY